MTAQPLTATQPAVQTTNLTKTYGAGPTAVSALADVSVAFGAGEFTAIMGRPGPASRPCCTAWPASTPSRTVRYGSPVSS
ncbi:hypothetical protein Asera_07460 [Actinocatenispora sera]|uniref:Uncharacterized protein n=1 Tax=Actinocatenispora sera TaxID=390989 RepID=A0A810KX43_9ACTN|nr:hypothetical protein Asera_07460 [Actinocatenispora sera]